MTARELSTRTGLSIGRISQLTKGWRKGEKQYPASLIEGARAAGRKTDADRLNLVARQPRYLEADFADDGVRGRINDVDDAADLGRHP